MKQELVKSPIGELEIRQRIRTIRGVQVMLDRDLAEFCGDTPLKMRLQLKRQTAGKFFDYRISISEKKTKSLSVKTQKVYQWKCKISISVDLK